MQEPNGSLAIRNWRSEKKNTAIILKISMLIKLIGKLAKPQVYKELLFCVNLKGVLLFNTIFNFNTGKVRQGKKGHSGAK